MDRYLIMSKREKLALAICIITMLALSTGYLIGTIANEEVENTEKSVYELIQEGYERLEEQ